MNRAPFLVLTAGIVICILAAGIFFVKIFPDWNHVHGSLPICNGHPADVYVDSGIIIGGPNNGAAYTGTLIANTPSVIVGTDGNDNITGSSSDDIICPGNGNDTINGNGGSDTLAFSTTSGTSGITISMSGEDAGSIIAGAALSTFSNVKNITGTAYNDVFYLHHPLTGNLDGGDGVDTVDYSQLATGATANLFTGIITNVGGTTSNIENLTGGMGDNILIGNSSNNTLRGYTAKDIIFGGDGDDTIDGGQGYNVLIGGKGADSISASGRANVTLFTADETSYSNSSTVDIATLSAIMAQWSSGSVYADKIASIISAYLSTSTLQYDNSADAITENSSSITDWYILKTSQDTLSGSFPGEVITDTSSAGASPESSSGNSNGGGGNSGGGGSPTSASIALTQPLPSQKILTQTNQTFATKVPDFDQVKKVTMRIFGKTYVLSHARGSATYKTTIKTPPKPGTYVYVLTAYYSSHDVKQSKTILISQKIDPKVVQALTASINTLFQAAYNRQPTYSEWLYWANRIKNGDKQTITALLGAMQWQALHR